MGIPEVFERLRGEQWYRGQVVAVEEVPSRPGKFSPPPEGLAPSAQAWLKSRGIQLFSHQAQAMAHLLGGEDVILATGPSSGKTLAMALPILSGLLGNPEATALLIYPLKALAQDQLGKWTELAAGLGLSESLGVYDGDTPSHRRPGLRRKARIILTNPYALHQYLEWHHLWAPFLAHLSYVVVDEAHWYRGVFGSGVALLFRRLARLLSRYGARPVYALASATSGDPGELARRLLGREAIVLTEDGSPQGRRLWWFWDPDLDEGRSSFEQALELSSFLIHQGLQTLVFVPSRRMAEALSRALQEREGNKVAAYRAGYLPEERRALEQGLREGALDLVVATPALEVGVDIGGLEAVVMMGYPGSLASARQQSGRAGRAGRDALVVYLPEDDPLDRYFLSHPKELIAGPEELPVLNPHHRELLLRHALCAAAEAPLREEDLALFGLDSRDLEGLGQAGLLHHTQAGWIYSGRVRPAGAVSLEALSSHQVRLLCDGQLIEVWDDFRARREAHSGAILLHQGQAFRVRALLLEEGRAELEPYSGDLSTKAVTTEQARIRRREGEAPGAGFGTVWVQEEVRAYKILHRGRMVGMEPLSLPPMEFETDGVWLLWEDASGPELAGALHGAEHALAALVPLLVQCGSHDVGGVSSPFHPDTARPTVLIYDAFPGGIGISRALFSRLREWVARTAEHLASCPCENGCPRCVLSPRCGSGNHPMDKAGAARILREWLDGPLG